MLNENKTEQYLANRKNADNNPAFNGTYNIELHLIICEQSHPQS